MKKITPTKIKNKIFKTLKYLFSKNEKFSLVKEDNIKKLMMHFFADEYGHESNIEKADLGYGWYHYGMIRLIKPKRILCVGSRQGYIPSILAQSCKDNGFGQVDFVDAGYGLDENNHWTGIGFWKTDEGKNVFRNFGLGNHISVFVKTTEAFAKKYSSNKYDYIYIDADHSYKGASRDYDLFWPMLRSGGLMAFHDIGVKENKPEGEYGVWRLWKKIKRGKQTFEVPFSGSGLGSVQK
jgi:predicted O-methyltransferase YrrM